MMKKHILKILNIAIVFCIAAGVYMRALLFSMGYEYDELFTAVTTDPELSFSWIYSHWLMADVHPPLYNALLWVWNLVAPYGAEKWLRLPSLFFGLGALACAWFMFPRRLGKAARFVFIALLACNTYVVAYSQHARSYMLVLLFSVPLTFLFLEISRSVWRGRTVSARRWAAFGVLSVLLCWSHYFGALLFGSFSVVLFAQAVYYKRELKWFVIVPGLVFAAFLPWLVPNLLTQLEYRRFVGNWWANNTPFAHVPLVLWLFFMSDFKSVLFMFPILAACAWTVGKRYKRSRMFARERELAALAATMCLALLCVTLLSVKTFMFIGRYFTSFIPVVFLGVALLTAPLLRRSVMLHILFIGFLLCGLARFWVQHNLLLDETNAKMPARLVSQFYRDYFQGKEMFVVALEAFPPAVMPAMYGYYVNKVYHLNVPVTELFSLEEEEREAALARRHDALVWMPNCTMQPGKLDLVSRRWNRQLEIVFGIGGVCILNISEKTSPAPEKESPASEEDSPAQASVL